MAIDRTRQQVKLQDGRTLGYAGYGAPQGAPVIYSHGFPGSRLDYLLADAGDAATETNARIIAVDRPGMGLSAFNRGRQLLDWPDDVTELADALQIDRFTVLGNSGVWLTPSPAARPALTRRRGTSRCHRTGWGRS